MDRDLHKEQREGFVSSLEELWVFGRVDCVRTGRTPGELGSWRRKIAQRLGCGCGRLEKTELSWEVCCGYRIWEGAGHYADTA